MVLLAAVAARTIRTNSPAAHISPVLYQGKEPVEPDEPGKRAAQLCWFTWFVWFFKGK